VEDIEIEEARPESLSLQNNEKDLIIKALEKHKGRRNKAADELGISQRTLYRKIKQYNLRRIKNQDKKQKNQNDFQF
jgi:transcriptional regulator with PAS, ATPase and Fis domain